MTGDYNRKALHITKDAKNNIFVDCDIEGVKNEGQGTQMFKTRIYTFRKKHPNLWKGGILGLIGLVASIITIFSFFSDNKTIRFSQEHTGTGDNIAGDKIEIVNQEIKNPTMIIENNGTIIDLGASEYFADVKIAKINEHNFEITISPKEILNTIPILTSLDGSYNISTPTKQDNNGNWIYLLKSRENIAKINGIPLQRPLENARFRIEVVR